MIPGVLNCFRFNQGSIIQIYNSYCYCLWLMSRKGKTSFSQKISKGSVGNYDSGIWKLFLEKIDRGVSRQLKVVGLLVVVLGLR